MKASEIRRQFLEYFAERDHHIVPSSPVFPQDDPTLLFTNAGMNQFKDVFLGSGHRDYARAADTQKCIRVSGKHNDLEEVGVDSYHHTFFEMLGNWSFGDYFKAEAIEWAWKLLTEVWGLPKERLWVTVFGGATEDGVPADEEAERLWLEKTDIAPDRVLRFGKKDNFWEMGDTGPCGPCSEIHFDRGDDDSVPSGWDPADGANPAIGVNAGNERFIEIWNLVFIQFNRLDDGSLHPLPACHVDTGMGFERLVALLQGKKSNYDTDVFSPIFARIGALCGTTYGGSASSVDIAFRVIADHVRAVCAALADGALPSNVGRGYVIRRLIRRASRYARQELGVEKPLLCEVVPAVVETLGETFPEIAQRAEHLETIIRAEEVAFGKTLGRGLLRFEELAKKTKEGGTIDGAVAFELYATSGFPRDLVELMARERGLHVDGEGWTRAEGEHRQASRSSGKFTQLLSAEELTGLAATVPTSREEGDAGHRQETEVLRLVGREPGPSCLVVAASPFYPEGGGQIGDAGVIEALDGSFRFRVSDTQRMGEVLVHIGEPEGVAEAGLAVEARVCPERRARIRRHHTATHLLHLALREVLGDHVAQQGSYVGPDRLRFDLSHPQAVTPEELERIETRVNDLVRRNHPVTCSVEELEAAKARGVMALFGEKYEEQVRVVEVGPPGGDAVSAELCGGTHVAASGDIGTFVIASEAAIQAGVRRIEALAGHAALDWVQEQRRLVQGVARALKAGPDEIVGRIEQLQAKVKEARKQAGQSAKADVESSLTAVKEGLEERDGIAMGVVILDVPQAVLRDLTTRVKGLHEDLAVLLLGKDGDKVPWIAVCQGQAVTRGMSAQPPISVVREHHGGGGGGKPELAQGQGKGAAARENVVAAYRSAPESFFGA